MHLARRPSERMGYGGYCTAGYDVNTLCPGAPFVCFYLKTERRVRTNYVFDHLMATLLQQSPLDAFAFFSNLY